MGQALRAWIPGREEAIDAWGRLPDTDALGARTGALDEFQSTDWDGALFRQQGQQSCVGIPVSSGCRYGDLEAPAVQAGDRVATRTGLDVHGEDDVGALPMPEPGSAIRRHKPVPSGAMKRFRNWITNRTRIGENRWRRYPATRAGRGPGAAR